MHIAIQSLAFEATKKVLVSFQYELQYIYRSSYKLTFMSFQTAHLRLSLASLPTGTSSGLLTEVTANGVFKVYQKRTSTSVSLYAFFTGVCLHFSHRRCLWLTTKLTRRDGPYEWKPGWVKFGNLSRDGACCERGRKRRITGFGREESTDRGHWADRYHLFAQFYYLLIDTHHLVGTFNLQRAVFQ